MGIAHGVPLFSDLHAFAYWFWGRRVITMTQIGDMLNFICYRCSCQCAK